MKPPHECLSWKLLALSASLLFAYRARASIIIDDFSQTTATWPISIVTSPTNDSRNETGPLSGVLGGQRNTSVTATTIDFALLDEVRTFIVPSLGVLSYSSTDGAAGTLVLTYKFTAGTFPVSDLALGVNLSSYDSPNGQIMNIKADFLNGPTDLMALTKPTSGSGAQTVSFPFAQFIGAGPLSQANTLTLTFTAPKAADFRIDSAQTVVPEPTAVGLLVAAGTLVLRRRRN